MLELSVSGTDVWLNLRLWRGWVARLRRVEVGMRWVRRRLRVLVRNLRRPVRWLRRNLVVVGVVVVWEMLLEIVVGVVGRVVVAPIQGEVGVDLLEGGKFGLSDGLG